VSVSGSNVTSWPFEYQGREHEITDPYNLYYGGSANMYNPKIQHELSQAGAGGLAGPSAGASGTTAGPSSSGSSFGASDAVAGSAVGGGAAAATAGGILAYNTFLAGVEGASVGYATPAVIAGFVAEALYDIFDAIFGGGSSAPIPRQLMHRRHPLYGQIIGIDSGLIPTEGSSANPGRPLTNCEKCALAPYIPQVELNNARIHTNGVPWYTPSSMAGITRNNDIYFRPGVYNASTPEGLGLLGHELVSCLVKFCSKAT
jgi:hypothetical protein